MLQEVLEAQGVCSRLGLGAIPQCLVTEPPSTTDINLYLTFKPYIKISPKRGSNGT